MPKIYAEFDEHVKLFEYLKFMCFFLTLTITLIFVYFYSTFVMRYQRLVVRINMPPQENKSHELELYLFLVSRPYAVNVLNNCFSAIVLAVCNSYVERPRL